MNTENSKFWEPRENLPLKYQKKTNFKILIYILPFGRRLCKLRNTVTYLYKGCFMNASKAFLLRTPVVLSCRSHVLLFVICF
jgi:hypothetical protein